MKTSRVFSIMLCAVLIVLPACVSGCEEQGGKEGLLWAWPSKKEAGAVTGTAFPQGRTAFFRFREPPVEGSLDVEVRPAVPYRVGYAGQIVYVWLESLGEPPYEVTLKNRNGKEIGKAYVGRPKPQENEPLVNIVERRARSLAGGGGSSEEYPLALRADDGCSVRAGFGSVAVEIKVPSTVPEQALRDAVTLTPSEGARIAFKQVESLAPDGATWNVLTIEWPGVEASGADVVDPAEVAKSTPAPPGFALKMQVSVDAKKLPVFKDVSGMDGVFKVSVLRAKPSSYSIRSLEDAAVTVPFKGFRTVHSVKAAPHRFALTFTKPVDRGSVERALVSSVMMRGPLPSFSFDWKSDDELECVITPPDLRPWGGATYRINVTGSFDREGLPLWFLEPLVVRFAIPLTQVRVRAEDPGGTPETIGELPPGISAVIPSPRGEYMLGFEVAEPQDTEGPNEYHPWLYSSSTGKWTDLGSNIKPLWNAQWLDEQHVITWDWDGWEVIEVPSGKVTRTEWKDKPGLSLFGLCPSPDGKTLAIIQGKRNTHSYEAADLLICDLEGNVLKRWPGITGTDRRDFYGFLIPVLYTAKIGGSQAGTPGTPESQGPQSAARISGTIFLVDRLKDGPTRVLQVDVESGTVSAVPGTEYASRSPRDALAVFGENPTYLAFVNLHDEEEITFPGTPEGVHVIDLDKGKPVGSVGFTWAGEFIGRHLLPSPGGRFLLAGQTLADMGALLKQPEGDWTRWPKLPGAPVGWSPDGVWVYVLKSAQ